MSKPNLYVPDIDLETGFLFNLLVSLRNALIFFFTQNLKFLLCVKSFGRKMPAKKKAVFKVKVICIILSRKKSHLDTGNIM